MIQKCKHLICFCLTVLLLLCSMVTTSVYADVVTIPNDGTATDVPYGDSHLASSYSDADYYDCYIPYTLEVKDVGGWACGYYNAMSAYSYSMSDYPRRLEYKIGCSTMTREGNKSTGSTYHGTTVSEDSLGMDVFTDANGNQYYACALPFFMYNFGGLSMASGVNFPEWGSSSNGQAFDMILTDGTCIHFIVCDHKAIAHTNWGNNGTSPSNSDVQYYYDPIIYTQYANIFQAANGETFELWGAQGCVSNFMSYYGISGTGNKVAIVRMYDIDLDFETPTRPAEVGTSVSYTLADTISISSVEGGHATGTNSLYTTGSSLVKEWALVGMPTRHDLSDYQSIISLPTRDNMGINEQNAVVQLGENIDLVRQANVFDTMRIAVTAVGLVVVLYGIFLLLGLLFDKANSFIEISMISLLTFGRLNYDPWDDNQSSEVPKGYASAKKIVIISVVVIVVGMSLLSSSLTRIIGEMVYWIYSKAV